MRTSFRTTNGTSLICNIKVDNKIVNDNAVGHISCLISKKHRIDGLAD